MLKKKISFNQDKLVEYEGTQGVEWTIILQWLQDDGETPWEDFEDFEWLAQIRAGAAVEGEDPLIEFNIVADDDGNVYEVDTDEATTTFILSPTLTRSFTAGQTYYFEAKRIDIATGTALESFKATLKADAEYAR